MVLAAASLCAESFYIPKLPLLAEVSSQGLALLASSLTKATHIYIIGRGKFILTSLKHFI